MGKRKQEDNELLMSNYQVALLFKWRMCSDPFPLDEDDMMEIDDALNSLARIYGCRDWVHAYHQVT